MPGLQGWNWFLRKSIYPFVDPYFFGLDVFLGSGSGSAASIGSVYLAGIHSLLLHKSDDP